MSKGLINLVTPQACGAFFFGGGGGNAGLFNMQRLYVYGIVTA